MELTFRLETGKKEKKPETSEPKVPVEATGNSKVVVIHGDLIIDCTSLDFDVDKIIVHGEKKVRATTVEYNPPVNYEKLHKKVERLKQEMKDFWNHGK